MKDKTVLYKCLYGSKLYGTDGPESDTDYKLIYLPSGKDILLGNTKTSGASSTGKKGQKNTKDDIDTDSMSFQKFINSLKIGEQNALDILFSYYREECIVECHPLWHEFMKSKDVFLSKNIKGAIGFIRSQTNRYIVRGDRMSAVEKMLEVLSLIPSNEKLSLHKEKILDYMEDVQFFELTSSDNAGGHFSVCERKAPVGIKCKDAYDIYKKLYDEYGARTRAAKDISGSDLKGISHAIRIATEVCELLETGHITFPVLNSDYIKSVKYNEVDVDDYSPYLDSLLVKCDKLLEESMLKSKVNEKEVDDFIVKYHLQQIF